MMTLVLTDSPAVGRLKRQFRFLDQQHEWLKGSPPGILRARGIARVLREKQLIAEAIAQAETLNHG